MADTELIARISADVSDIKGAIAGLEMAVTMLHETCPHREAIARSANNRVRIELAEAKAEKAANIMSDLRILVAGVAIKTALITSGSVSIVGGIITAVILGTLGK